MREIIRVIENQDMGNLLGLQAMSTRVTTRPIQEMATAKCTGPMEHVIKAIGWMEFNMATGRSMCQAWATEKENSITMFWLNSLSKIWFRIHSGRHIETKSRIKVALSIHLLWKTRRFPEPVLGAKRRTD